jgi:hypothetical protein
MKLKKVVCIAIVLLVVGCGTPEAIEEVPLKYNFYLPYVISKFPNTRGIGLTWRGCPLRPTCSEIEALGVSWMFVWWWNFPQKYECPGIESMSMIADMWQSEICRDVGGTSDILLLYNEPELPLVHHQSYISPTLAAEGIYRIELCYPDKKLVAPAVSWIDNTKHENGSCWWADTMENPTCRWLEDTVSEFEREYGRLPRFYALGAHCYPYAYLGNDLLKTCEVVVDYLADLRERWDIPQAAIINEYGPAFKGRSQSVIDEEARDVTEFLENNPDVYRHAIWTYRTWSWRRISCYRCFSRQLTSYGEIYGGE